MGQYSCALEHAGHLHGNRIDFDSIPNQKARNYNRELRLSLLYPFSPVKKRKQNDHRGSLDASRLAYDAPRHPLHKYLIWCFYSTGDIAVMSLGADGLPTTVEKLRIPTGKLQISGPLDITQDIRTGNLYIADFGKQSKFGADGSLVLLRPAKSPP